RFNYPRHEPGVPQRKTDDGADKISDQKAEDGFNSGDVTIAPQTAILYHLAQKAGNRRGRSEHEGGLLVVRRHVVPKTEQHGQKRTLRDKDDRCQAQPLPTPGSCRNRLSCSQVRCAAHPALSIRGHCNTTSRSAQICLTYLLKSRLSRAAIMSVRSMPSSIS